MYDYSQINFRTFEYLAQKYLTQKFPNFQWEVTPSSGDGNKDILCKYKVLNQEQEYWAEAKFTKSRTPHTLSKGQLDPTLISALLSPKQVSLCFISNNQITETYYYRLKDFKIKTNIGIELILKDEFEDWLSKNPTLLQEYNIRLATSTKPQEHGDCEICSAVVTDILNSNQYKTENYLLEGTIYYLYVIINSSDTYKHIKLKTNPEFSLLHRARLLDNPENLCLEKGKRVYKFELLPLQTGNFELRLQLIYNQITVAGYSINGLTITPNSNIGLSYVQQEKSLYEISYYIRESGEHNFLIPIIGNGATGKTKLIQDLHDELNGLENILLVSFIGNEYLDAKTLIQILIFFNIGNIFDYEKKDILLQIDTICDERQKIYYNQLIKGYFGTPESCVKELSDKLHKSAYDICLLYPSHSNVQQVLLLDDVHKGKNHLSLILEMFIRQFIQQENNQSIIFACREYHKDFSFDISMLKKDWIKPFYLDGLTKKDKLATISHYFSSSEDIQFDRTTDDLIVFSNILQSQLSKEKKYSKNDPISKNVELVRAFENPKIVNIFQYKEKLNQMREYHYILEVIYFVNFGINYAMLIRIFPHKDIDFLLNKKVIKRVGKKVFPYHDHYVQAYFEEHKISDFTVETIKKIESFLNNYDEKYLYLSLLLKSGYHVYCQITEEAHALEQHYFKITDYYKAYVIAKAFEDYMNFNEPLSFQEIYDLMVLAISSGFFEKPNDVKKRYTQLINLGPPLSSRSDVQGIILRAHSEIVNIDYWELEIQNLTEKIDFIIKQIPLLTPYSNEDIICAYLNLMNRKMVVALLADNFNMAKEIFYENLTEIDRLNHEEYVGYLYMDYAKGLYNSTPETALEYMEKAQMIFQKLGTEYRRLLDCSCEVEYLKCLITDTGDFSKLECAAQDLIEAHYLELYAKAKLKLAALKLTNSSHPYSSKDIEQELYLSEYVLEYPATGRLLLLQRMVKNAFFVYSGEAHKVINLSLEEKNLINNLGISYRHVWDFNEKGIKHFVQFWNGNAQPYMYTLDARIW